MSKTEALPGAAHTIAEEFPEIWQAFTRLGAVCSDAGPLDDRTKRLIKIALTVGSWFVGGTHSQDATRDREELEQIAFLCIPTLGFPHAAAALTWVRDCTRGDGKGPPR